MSSKFKLVGNIQEELYGIPFEYQYGNIFLMNRFLRYLIQNLDTISEKLLRRFDEAVVTKFATKINGLNEFEVTMFHNLEFLDAKELDNSFKLEVLSDCVYLRTAGLELKLEYPICLEIFSEGENVDLDEIENYNGKEVNLSFSHDFPPIFMTDKQIDKNFDYLAGFIDELLFLVGLNAKSSNNAIAELFNLEY